MASVTRISSAADRGQRDARCDRTQIRQTAWNVGRHRAPHRTIPRRPVAHPHVEWTDRRSSQCIPDLDGVTAAICFADAPKRQFRGLSDTGNRLAAPPRERAVGRSEDRHRQRPAFSGVEKLRGGRRHWRRRRCGDVSQQAHEPRMRLREFTRDQHPPVAVQCESERALVESRRRPVRIDSDRCPPGGPAIASKRFRCARSPRPHTRARHREPPAR